MLSPVPPSNPNFSTSDPSTSDPTDSNPSRVLVEANGRPVTGIVDRNDHENKDTQRLSFWHLRRLVKDIEEHRGLDRRLYPHATDADAECIYVMLKMWLNQDHEIAEMESFMERFSFPLPDGTKQNLLEIYMEEKNSGE